MTSHSAKSENRFPRQIKFVFRLHRSLLFLPWSRVANWRQPPFEGRHNGLILIARRVRTNTFWFSSLFFSLCTFVTRKVRICNTVRLRPAFVSRSSNVKPLSADSVKPCAVRGQLEISPKENTLYPSLKNSFKYPASSYYYILFIRRHL